MSHSWPSIAAVPALSLSVLLFAGGAGLAQKGGHGSGGSSGRSMGSMSAARVSPSASFRSSPSSGMHQVPMNSVNHFPSNAASFRNSQNHPADLSKNGNHPHDGDHHHDGHDHNRNRNIIVWWGGPWWWGWFWNPWYNNWYDPWNYGGAFAYNSYPANYSSYYAEPMSFSDSGPMSYTDDSTNGPPTQGPAAAEANRGADASRPPIDDNAVLIAVRLPADAELWFDGQKTTQTGPVRRFETPPLKPGQEYGYEIRARWMEDGHEVNQTRKVTVHAGDRLGLNFQSASGNNSSSPR